MRTTARAEAAEGEAYTSFEPDEEAGGYPVTCSGPAKAGHQRGDTREEVPAMEADAIVGCLEGPRRVGLPLPRGEVRETEPIREARVLGQHR